MTRAERWASVQPKTIKVNRHINLTFLQFFRIVALFSLFYVRNVISFEGHTSAWGMVHIPNRIGTRTAGDPWARSCSVGVCMFHKHAVVLHLQDQHVVSQQVGGKQMAAQNLHTHPLIPQQWTLTDHCAPFFTLRKYNFNLNLKNIHPSYLYNWFKACMVIFYPVTSL